MADLTYRVTVDTAQAQRSIDGLRNTLGALAAAFSVRQVTDFADSVTNLQNRLRTVSRSTDDAERQFRALLQIADSSRQSITDLGVLYTRLARAADDMGISQRDAAVLTDSIAKALQISGASAGEAASAMLQLSQAFGSGVLRGEELNALLESAPVLARILADSLGVTVGELRRLGEQGRLTSAAVASAFIDANATINDTFGRTVPTISQSFARVGNSLSVVFADIERNTGIFAALAASIISIAESLRDLSGFVKQNADAFATLGRILVGLGAAYLVFAKVLPGIQTLTTATYALLTAKGGLGRQVVILGGHFGRMITHIKNVVTGAGVAGSRLASLALVMSQVSKVFLRFAGIAGVFYAIAAAIDFVLARLGIQTSVLGSLGKAWDWLTDRLGIFQEQAESTNNTARDALADLNTEANARERVVKITLDQARALQAVSRGYQDSIENQISSLRSSNQLISATDEQRRLTEALQQAESSYYSSARQLQDELIKAREEAQGRESEVVNRILADLGRLDSAYVKNGQTIRDLIAEQSRLTAARELQDFATRRQIDVEDQLIKIQRDMARGSMSEIQQKYQDIRDAADDSARAAIRAEEARRGAPLDTTEIEAYYRAARQGQDRLIRATEQHVRQQRSWSAGWNRALRDYVDNATNAARQAENIFTKATRGMEDAIVNFVKTGKFEWRDFVNMMLEELLRAQIQQTFAGLLGGMQSSMQGMQNTQKSQGSAAGILGTVGSILGGGRNTGSVATPGFGGGGNSSGLGNILSSIGSIGSTISKAGSWINKNIFGGFFANGGTLPAGKVGIVGERGPEMISGPATITPLGATQVTYNINAVDAASFRALVARDPGFIYAVTEQGRRSLPVRAA